jgi:hypothetical protein
MINDTTGLLLIAGDDESYTPGTKRLQADGAYTCHALHQPRSSGKVKLLSPFLLSSSLTCAKFTSYFVIIFQPGEVNVQFHCQEIHRQQKRARAQEALADRS